MTGNQFAGTGVMAGTLPVDGQISGTITYDPDHIFPFTGNVGFGADGHLQGTLNQDFAGTNVPISIDLTQTSGP